MSQNMVDSNAELNDEFYDSTSMFPARRSGVALRYLVPCLAILPLWLMPMADAATEIKPSTCRTERTSAGWFDQPNN